MAPRTHAIWKRVMTVLRRPPGVNGIGHGDNHRRLRGVCATNVSATNGGPPHRRTAANQRNRRRPEWCRAGDRRLRRFFAEGLSSSLTTDMMSSTPPWWPVDSRPSAIKSRDGGGNSPVGEAGCQRPPHTCAALGIPVSDPVRTATRVSEARSWTLGGKQIRAIRLRNRCDLPRHDGDQQVALKRGSTTHH
jgi:hypothetical protein